MLVHLDEELFEPSATEVYRRAVMAMEWHVLTQVLFNCEGNISEACRRLGITRNTFRQKLARLKLQAIDDPPYTAYTTRQS